MPSLRRWLVASLALCVVTVVIFVEKTGHDASSPNRPPSELSETSARLVETSFATRSTYDVASGTRLLLIPHHLVAGRQIASLLGSVHAPKRVILLSPDHFSQGKQAFSTTEQTFRWQTQPIATDHALETTLISKLSPHLKEQASVFGREHGVRGLLPFIKTAWPEAAIVPITVRVDSSTSSLATLAQSLQTYLHQDPDLLVVFTIDFSHDLPAYIADIHDRFAQTILTTLNADASWDAEIDSPPLLWLLTTCARNLYLDQVTIHAHTNALYLMHAQATELGTSHFIASFSPGARASSSEQTVLVHDPRRNAISKENRFFQGFTKLSTTTIPFPTDYVRITTETSTEWLILPLKSVEEFWIPFSDAEQNTLSASIRSEWEHWAMSHLPSPSKP